ncbi:ethionine resistance protein [Blastocladiella emersonii ATCC 22665]|nr:ethionine resistance protein [Blastocladiella emersonii ATCC 22665]
MTSSDAITHSTSEPAAEAAAPRAPTPSHGRIPLPTAQEAWTEAKTLVTTSIPCIAGSSLSFANNVLPTLMIGHLGATELAAATLAVMFSNILGFSICFGLSSSLDTLASQAVTGAKNPRQPGIYLQRAILINFTIAIPLTFLWWFAEPLLRLAGQDHDLARMAGQYIRVLWLGLFPMIVSDCTAKFLVAQGVVNAQLFVSLITIPINGGLGYFLTFVDSPLKLGFFGTAAANTVSEWIGMCLLILYVWRVDGHQFWAPWSLDALRGWKPFIALGVPGMLQVCSEWWLFEFVALMAGILGPLPLAAQAILINTSSLLITVFYGFGMVSSARVGNFLGAGNAKAASHTMATSIVVGLAASLVISVLLFSFRYQVPYIFTSDADVIALAASVIPILTLFQFADASVCIIGGAIRGCGKQKVGAMFNLGAYYLLGIPLGLILTFVAKVGLSGMWWGLAAGLTTCFVCEVIYMTRYIDWHAEVDAALARVNAETFVDVGDEQVDLKKESV